MDFPDDLILEIISFLPAGLAVQCKCLNKKFNKLISDPKFVHRNTLVYPSKKRFLHCCNNPSNLTTFYSKISLNHSYTKNLPPFRNHYTGLKMPLMSSASSGRLLLSTHNRGFCVFNPFTGAYLITRYPGTFAPPLLSRTVAAGLVDEGSSPHFKLVTVFQGIFCNLFLVIFNSETKLWRKGAFDPQLKLWSRHIEDSSPALYLNGCLHWLFYDSHFDILVFDVSNEKSRIIKAPDVISELNQAERKNLSFNMRLVEAGGLLTLVICYREKVEILVHDFTEKKWRCKDVIDHIFCPWDAGRGVWFDGKSLIPEYFDGESLIFAAGNHPFSGDKVDVFEYEIGKRIWKKIGDVPFSRIKCDDSVECLHPFVPTSVGIHGCSYLHLKEERVKKLKCNVRKALFNLQSLLLGSSFKVGFIEKLLFSS